MIRRRVSNGLPAESEFLSECGGRECSKRINGPRSQRSRRYHDKGRSAGEKTPAAFENGESYARRHRRPRPSRGAPPVFVRLFFSLRPPHPPPPHPRRRFYSLIPFAVFHQQLCSFFFFSYAEHNDAKHLSKTLLFEMFGLLGRFSAVMARPRPS